ncbi:hypothetical protein DL96DRAFT_1820562 [Flagelloscypha sp. PMI_526]|nr:hypothetical protein DL96DRAFT_1820562 [Flagelloscypha sp. PMI_526]
MSGNISNIHRTQGLKKEAMRHAQRISRGQSAESLLASARSFILLGEEHHAKRLLVFAFLCFYKVGILTRLAHARAVVSKDQIVRRKTMEFTELYSAAVSTATKSLAHFIDTHGFSYPAPFASSLQYWDSSPLSSQVRKGLKNLGKTGYINATFQCLFASLPITKIDPGGRWLIGAGWPQYYRKTGRRSSLAKAFATLVNEYVWSDVEIVNPIYLLITIGYIQPKYKAGNQYDSQEFLLFFLDTIHKDTNRRPPQPDSLSIMIPDEREDLERLPVNIASEREWDRWKQKNDSFIVDYFQGQSMTKIECLFCYETLTTFTPFSILHVPIPQPSPAQRIPTQACLKALFNTEVLEPLDGWHCPNCNKKQLTRKEFVLTRLPPLLVIHLDRFHAYGKITNKIINIVDFPLEDLDMTEFVPSRMKSGGAGIEHANMEDPRTQVPPFKYDLCGVTNHDGNLTTGHYTAWVKCLDKWLLCDDEIIREGRSSQVVGREAYVLFYKRTR